MTARRTRLQVFWHRLRAPILEFEYCPRRLLELLKHCSVDALRRAANLSHGWMPTIGSLRSGCCGNWSSLCAIPQLGVVSCRVRHGGDQTAQAGYAAHVAWINSLL